MITVIAMHVAVEQGTLPPYRLPFFEALSRRVERLVVAHSGPPSAAEPNFEEVVLPLRSVSGVHFQFGLAEAVYPSDVLVVMFDLRWPANIVETVVARKTRRRLLWGHGLGRHRTLWPLRLAWIRRTDGVILYHEAQVHQLIALGVPKEKLFVAPNAVSLPELPEIELDLFLRKDSILFVGRLEERKRIDVLIEAFARLKAEGSYPLLRLDLVGRGSEQVALRAHASRLGLENSVHFHGSVFDPSELSRLFGRAIVYASPGATGLGLIHAFGHGVPAVIGINSGHGPEVQDLIPGRNGLKVPANPKDFSDGLRKLLTDTKRRDQMGRAAAEFVHSERRIERMVDGFMMALSPD